MRKILCMMMQNREGKYFQIKRLKVDEDKEIFKFGKKTYLLRPLNIAFYHKTRLSFIPVMYYDIDHTGPLDSDAMKKIIPNTPGTDNPQARDAELIWGRKTIDGLVRGSLGQAFNINMVIWLGLGIMVGLFVGIVISPYLAPLLQGPVSG